MTRHRNLLETHPAILIPAGFLVVIFLGTVMLRIPAATTSGTISWIDALFTSTSAVCVTGLIVVDTATYFTRFGQCILIFLIQIGGLGVMTLAVVFFRWIGKNLSFQQLMLMQDQYSPDPRRDIFRLIRHVLGFTLAIEGAGTLFLFYHWSIEMPVGEAFFTALFHSVSAFCNAGFSVFSDSLMRYRGDALVNTVICLLIITGGIGFPVLYELASRIRNIRRRHRHRLSVQTKTVLVTTGILIVAGALIFGALERNGSCRSLSGFDLVLSALFQSVTCRTAGFNTVDIASLNHATLMVMVLLMFFGASPGSCGGGVKTTTLAILIAFLFSGIRRKRRVNLFYKSIPAETLNRAMALIILAAAIVTVFLFLLLVSMPGTDRSFLSFLFETISAFGTVGLSMGLTATLGVLGKIWIVMLMIIGRIGVLTFGYTIAGIGAPSGFEYAEENLMIG